MGYWNNNTSVPFEELKGKTITQIVGMAEGSEHVQILTEDGSEYTMQHYQDCCENVRILEIIGDVDDLIGSEILTAEEVSQKDTNRQDSYDSGTWTFYKLSTRKGYVDIRWLGESNGYYSEAVDFEKVNPS